MGWAEIKNRDLLALTENNQSFLLLSTAIFISQNISHLDIAVVVLRGRTDRLRNSRPLVRSKIHG